MGPGVGVAVGVEVGVLVGVAVGVFVGVAVGVFVGVAVGVFVGVGVAPPSSFTIVPNPSERVAEPFEIKFICRVKVSLDSGVKSPTTQTTTVLVVSTELKETEPLLQVVPSGASVPSEFCFPSSGRAPPKIDT